jgi:hypothetical protein
MSELGVLAESAAFWTEVGVGISVPGTVLALMTLLKPGASWFSQQSSAATPSILGQASGPKALLPAPCRFINRDADMRNAMAKISRGEIVLAIDGGAGVGKSATATELAHRLRAVEQPLEWMIDLRKHTFLWIDCRYECPSLVDICGPLSLLTGDQSLSIVSHAQKLDALRVHLATHKTVLVLDNLTLNDDHKSQALRDVLRTVPTGSLVIASVNRPCLLEAALVPLSDLDPLDALTLIQHEVDCLDLSGAGTFDEAFARRLCGAVGGNPRIIRWFLQTLSSSGKSLYEYLAAVERGDTVPGPEMVAPMWEDLTATSRTVLAACAYLRGQAIADQLIIACDLTEDEVTAALEELIWVGLVTTVWVTDRPNVYTCAQGLRRFVLAETTEHTLSAFTNRLADYYVGYFTETPEDAGRAIPHVGALQTVLQELFALENDPDLQSLFRATLDIFFTLGLFDDRIAAGAIAYESAIRTENHGGASLASEVLSSTHAVRGELAEAREALALGLVASESAGTAGEKARQMRCSGLVSYRSCRPREALTQTEGAEALAESEGQLEILVNILDLRIAAYWYLGSIDDCEVEAYKCLHVCDQMPWERAKAYSLRHLAEISIHRGAFSHARERLQDARSIAIDYEDKRGLARIALTEARLHLVTGRPRVAAQTASYAESEANALGLPPEAREARALRVAAMCARFLPPLRLYYAWRRPIRLSDSPVGGD